MWCQYNTRVTDFYALHTSIDTVPSSFVDSISTVLPTLNVHWQHCSRISVTSTVELPQDLLLQVRSTCSRRPMFQWTTLLLRWVHMIVVSLQYTPLHVPLHDILFGCHIMSSNTCTCILLLSTVKCRSSSLLRDSFILVVWRRVFREEERRHCATFARCIKIYPLLFKQNSILSRSFINVHISELVRNGRKFVLASVTHSFYFPSTHATFCSWQQVWCWSNASLDSALCDFW